jgi:hypothetical protein
MRAQEAFNLLKISMLCIAMTCTDVIHSQQKLTLHIYHPDMPWSVSDSVVMDIWKYYLCDLGCSPSSFEECILVESDTTIPLTCDIGIQKTLTFSLGVDSLKQAHPDYSGDLNPLKSMYWTWQSGYIQLKAEGKVLQPNGTWQSFQLHLGGFRNYPTIQKIQRPINGDVIELRWDEKKLSQLLQLNPRSHIMSECAESSSLMSQISHCIQIR